MERSITERLRDCGIEARLIPVSALENIKEAYGRLDHSSALWKDMLCNMTLDIDEGQEARSILVAAVSSPAINVTFRTAGQERSFYLPPTYLFKRQKNMMKQHVERILSGFGLSASQKYVPCKMLAVMSSLAEYGRNNIAYVEGLGSYALLQAYVTTAEPETEPRDIIFAKTCEKCAACVSACPTGAISNELTIINAERCVTFYNEKDQPFPEWIPKNAHSCVVGCMRCQLACPMDSGKLKIEQGPVFDEAETEMILLGKRIEQLPEATIEKLRDIEQDGSYNSFVRNVRALLEQ